MSPNPVGYDDAVNLTKHLERQYEAVRTEMKAVAENAAREEVKRVAAAHQTELQRLIGDALAKERGGGGIGGLTTRQFLEVAAVVLLLWLGGRVVVNVFSGRWGSERTKDVVQTGTNEEADTATLPLIDRDPLHQVAEERYDSLFVRRDPAFRQLIEGAGTREGATLDTIVARALARWEDDSTNVTNDDREMVHAAAFQAALREVTADYTLPLSGRVDRDGCAQDQACRNLVARWRVDRSTGLRLLPPIPDSRTPGSDDLRKVEKVVVYSRLGQ